ncbi:MAG: hypothetical protein KKA64_03340 [Nanoarchaeota archaeon]|nr:hypothetical protein [Nanoarchaeota archaeon]
MDYNKLTVIATSMIAFTGFLIGIATVIYYTYQIKRIISPIYVITGVNIYILINLIFLYILKRGINKK